MYCKHCGREIGDGQRFCSYCGARQQENGPDQVPPQPDGTTATQTGNYHYDAPPPTGGAPTGGNDDKDIRSGYVYFRGMGWPER